MENMTLSIPKELKDKLAEFKEMNWSAVARAAFVKRMKQLEILNKLEKDFANSKLTDKDCLKLGRELRRAIFEAHKEE